MTLVADVHVSGPDLLLAGTIAAVPEATFSVVFQGGTDALFVSVEGATTEDVLAAAERDPTVTDVAVTAENRTRRVLRVRRTADRSALSSVLAEMDVRVVRSRSEGDGWLLRLELPDRERIGSLRSHLEESGVAFRLERLFEPEEPATAGEYGLTDDQRTTLLTAFEAGYFEVPRRASQRDLAAALGVSGSAVSQRIRRAVATLVENTLAATASASTDGGDGPPGGGADPVEGGSRSKAGSGSAGGTSESAEGGPEPDAGGP